MPWNHRAPRLMAIGYEDVAPEVLQEQHLSHIDLKVPGN